MAKGKIDTTKRNPAKRRETRKAQADVHVPHTHFAFSKENYKWMLIGLGVILLGFILMAGPTEDIYNSSEALRNTSFSFSTHLKITVAPLVVLAGFVIEIFAIMKKPQTANESD